MNKLPKEEISRKLLHLLALIMPTGIFYFTTFFHTSWVLPSILLGIAFFGSAIVERIRFVNPKIQALFYKFFGSMLRKEESFKITGSTWIIGSAFICSIIFRNEPYISFIVLTLFILGDAVAAIVGMKYGRIKIGKKSLEGSLACFLLCMVFFLFVFPIVPGLLESYGGKIPIEVAVSISLIITLLELIPLYVTRNFIINDNLAVPIIAGLALRYLRLLFL